MLKQHPTPINGIPRVARNRLRDAPEAWYAWVRTCEAMENPDFELTVEDFAAFLAQFKTLRRLGVPFAESFIARIGEMERQAFGTLDDGDEDASDERLDLENSDEDGTDGEIEDDYQCGRPRANPNDPADPRNWTGPELVAVT